VFAQSIEAVCGTQYEQWEVKIRDLQLCEIDSVKSIVRAQSARELDWHDWVTLEADAVASGDPQNE
jgi:hypothetical protein